MIKSCKSGGNIASVGMIAGINLKANVLPFLMRGVTLWGIASLGLSHEVRKSLWDKLGGDWKPE